MPVIYKRNCDTCGEYYEGRGKYFCSAECRFKNGFSKETRLKMREAKLGVKQSVGTRIKKSIAMNGDKNPNWKGGKTKQCLYKHLTNFEWKEWRKRVFERDNWTCQNCEARGQKENPVYLESHHIKGWTEYKELRYEVKNGITLCRECHHFLHSSKGHSLVLIGETS